MHLFLYAIYLSLNPVFYNIDEELPINIVIRFLDI